jgi:hypothetical protein
MMPLPEKLIEVLDTQPVNLIRYAPMENDHVYIVPSNSGRKDYGGWCLTKEQWQEVQTRWPGFKLSMVTSFPPSKSSE